VRSFDPILTQDPTVVVSTGGSWKSAVRRSYCGPVWSGVRVGGWGVCRCWLFAAVRRTTLPAVWISFKCTYVVVLGRLHGGVVLTRVVRSGQVSWSVGGDGQWTD